MSPSGLRKHGDITERPPTYPQNVPKWSAKTWGHYGASADLSTECPQVVCENMGTLLDLFPRPEGQGSLIGSWNPLHPGQGRSSKPYKGVLKHLSLLGEPYEPYPYPVARMG